jgi:hypothetical protein
MVDEITDRFRRARAHHAAHQRTRAVAIFDEMIAWMQRQPPRSRPHSEKVPALADSQRRREHGKRVARPADSSTQPRRGVRQRLATSASLGGSRCRTAVYARKLRRCSLQAGAAATAAQAGRQSSWCIGEGRRTRWDPHCSRTARVGYGARAWRATTCGVGSARTSRSSRRAAEGPRTASAGCWITTTYRSYSAATTVCSPSPPRRRSGVLCSSRSTGCVRLATTAARCSNPTWRS